MASERDEDDLETGGARNLSLFIFVPKLIDDELDGTGLPLGLPSPMHDAEADGLGAGDVPGDRRGEGRGKSWSSSSSASSSSGIRGVDGTAKFGVRSGDDERCESTMTFSPSSFNHIDAGTTESLDRRRLSTSSTLIGTPRLSPNDAAAALPSTVIVRGPSSALSERRLRADREKRSVQVSPCDRDASVTASHPAQHGRNGMVTRSEREGDNDVVRVGRRGLWGDPGTACEKAEAPDGER